MAHLKLRARQGLRRPKSIQRMSFLDLATELLFEIASYFNDDDTTTLLHFAMINRHSFVVIMPKLIAAQSTRIQKLTRVDCVLDLSPLERVFLEPNKIAYHNYWFHEDCKDNVFARSYGEIYLLFENQNPKYMYTHACALIRRAPTIHQVTLDIRYKVPSDCEWMGKLLDLCAQRSPPPSVVVQGKSQPLSNGRELRYDGPFDSAIAVRDVGCNAVNSAMRGTTKVKKGKLALRILNDIAKRLTTFSPSPLIPLSPLPPISLPQDARPYPRQPPRVSTKRSYRCNCWSPTHLVSVGKNPNLRELDIASDSMFMPSMYPYTVDFINLTPLTSLQFRNMELESRAWSQILYCLQIPTLKVFVLEGITIAFLDIVFFLQRHHSITNLGLFLHLYSAVHDGHFILPEHFDLPNLQALSASSVYATPFMQHHTAHRFKKLDFISIDGPLPLCSDIMPTEFFRLYDLLAAHYDQYTDIHLRFSFHSCHFVEWALQRLKSTNRPPSARGLLGALQLGTPRAAAREIPDQTFSMMWDWVKANCDDWPQRAEVQMESRRRIFQEFIYAICPLLKVWHDGGEQVDRYSH